VRTLAIPHGQADGQHYLRITSKGPVMRKLHEPDDLRPAPRTTPKTVLWILCAVAIGGIWLLHEGASQIEAAPPISPIAGAVIGQAR
jgi:hypothetical protein